MRVAAALFALLFGLGTIVQWNDPDPLPWMLGYALAAGASLLAALDRTHFGLHLGLACVFAAVFATFAPSLLDAPGAAFTTFEMRAAAHEEPREAAGLALLTLWNAILAIWSWRRNRSA